MKNLRPAPTTNSFSASVRGLLFAFPCTLCTAAFSGPVALAQMHHVETPARVTRAVGVYEWTGDLSKPTAARFVPVSLFIDGQLQDAGLYLARPVPLALQPGDVYAVERAGEPQGTLDLDLAHRVVTGKALADDNTVGAWYGFGKFTPQIEAKAAPLHPSSHLPKLESSTGSNTPAEEKPAPADNSGQDRPHMNRRDTGTNSTGGSGSASGSSGTSGSSGSSSDSSGSSPATTGHTSTTAGTADDDVDRPTLRRRDPAQDAARRKEAGTKGKTASVTAAGPALGDDPDRPRLGHNNAENTGIPELTGLPANLHQAAAVSDAKHTDTHPFARPWDSPAERGETLQAMAALAKSRVAEYLATNQLVASNAPLPASEPVVSAATPAVTASVAAQASNADVPTPPKLQRGVPKSYRSSPAQASAGPSTNTASAAATKPAVRSSVKAPTASQRNLKPGRAHPASLSLGQEEISGFTLSYGGLPTFVYTAAASTAPGKAVSTANGPMAAFVTVVAQRLPSGELQIALSNVTDSAHLDRSARLRLVDAVDPDDSHRASLLFELRAASSRQFALYRLTSVRAEQIFTTATLE